MPDPVNETAIIDDVQSPSVSKVAQGVNADSDTGVDVEERLLLQLLEDNVKLIQRRFPAQRGVYQWNSHGLLFNILFFCGFR